MNIFDLFRDPPASECIIDLQFIETDLIEINLTDRERCQLASFDNLASGVNVLEDDSRPVGKRVY